MKAFIIGSFVVVLVLGLVALSLGSGPWILLAVLVPRLLSLAHGRR